MLVCRDAATAAKRFGVSDGSAGIVYTRTGRPFFDDAATTSAAGCPAPRRLRRRLLDELDTDWLLLDCELLPWSAKAEELIRSQYASVGAAAGAAIPDAITALQRAAARGLDVGDLLTRIRIRAENAARFREAYARYCVIDFGFEIGGSL